MTTSTISSLFLLLPDEVTDSIVHIIHSPSIRTLDFDPNLKTLSSLSRTNSTFHSRCTPFIYDTIRLPLTHTPEGSSLPLLIASRDTIGVNLARTMRQSQTLASLVMEVEITSRWAPEDGMERNREAYEDILNASKSACGLAFYVGRGEYNQVLQSISSSYPNLKCLSIGVENLERELKTPLLQPQLAPKLVPSNGSGKLDLRTSYLAPNLIHLSLQLPSYIKLGEKANLILASLPPTILFLEIALLLNPRELCEDLSGEADLSVDYGPGRKLQEIVNTLFKTRFVRKASGEDVEEVSSPNANNANKVELRLSSATLRFSLDAGTLEADQRAIQQLSSRSDLASYLPSPMHSSSEEQDPFIQRPLKQKELDSVVLKQPDQLLRLIIASPNQVNTSIEDPPLAPISREADTPGVLLWRSTLNDGLRKDLTGEKKLEVANARRGNDESGTL